MTGVPTTVPVFSGLCSHDQILLGKELLDQSESQGVHPSVFSEVPVSAKAGLDVLDPETGGSDEIQHVFLQKKRK
jgi:hypothetical protein